MLVNTARGPIVEDAAVHRALTEGWIAGAGLDDIEEEPAKQRGWTPENPLFDRLAAREVVRVLSGEPPHSPVNAAELAVGRR